MFYAIAIYQDDQDLVNDLFRFDTKAGRDSFVEERDYSESITRKEAEQKYKEQFAYWKQND